MGAPDGAHWLQTGPQLPLLVIQGDNRGNPALTNRYMGLIPDQCWVQVIPKMLKVVVVPLRQRYKEGIASQCYK